MQREEVDNPRYPHTIRIVRIVDNVSSLNPFDRAEGTSTETVIYDGIGRAYTDTTTDGDTRVDSNKRKASIPVRFDEWQGESPGGEPLWPMDGDTITTTKGNVVETGRVKDFEPDNDRSIVYWEFVRG